MTTRSATNSHGQDTLVEVLIDQIYPLAAMIIANGEEHEPMIFICNKGKVVGVKSMLKLPEAIWPTLQPYLLAKGFDFVILLTEAWAHMPENPSPADLRIVSLITEGKLRVSELPQRKEVLVFNVAAPGGLQWLCPCKIDRVARTLTRMPTQALHDPMNTVTGAFVVRPKTTPEPHVAH